MKKRPGRVEIHLSRSGGGSQVILIDENGLTMKINGNMLLNSTGNMTLAAGGQLLLHGEIIWAYGTFDEKTRNITGMEKLIVRDGLVTP
jgi:hypothetical protein